MYILQIIKNIINNMESSYQKTGRSFNLAHSSEDGPKKEKAKNPKLIARILDTIIIVSVAMCFFGLPLFFTGLSFQGIVFEKQIFFYFWTLIALISWVGKGVIDGEMKIRKTPLDIPIGLFWLVYLAATIFSVDRWHSFIGLFGDPSRGFMNITAIAIIYYILMSNFSGKMFRWILVSIMSSSMVVFVWSTLGVMGISFLPEKIARYAPLSLIGSVSGLGMFLAIILPILMTVILKIQSAENLKKGIKNILTGVLFIELILNIFLLVALYGFVPWIGFMIGIGFFLIFILSRVIRPAENWTWLPMVVFVILMVVLMLGGSNIARISLPVEVGPAFNLSFDVAKESLKNNFFLGSGAASYGYDFSLHKPQEFNLNQLYNLRFYQATGVIFEAISTIGAIGTLALILSLLSFVGASVFLLSIRKEKDKVYSLGFTTAAFIFIIASAMGRVEGTMLVFGALISAVALAIVIRESDSEENFLRLSLKASPKYALALAFIFMVTSAGVAYLFVFVGKTYVADVYAGSASRQSQVTEAGSVSKMARAINLNKLESKYYINIGRQYMVLANDEMLKKEDERNINLVQGYLNASIEAVMYGKNLSPNDVSAVEALAQIYENAGMYVNDSLKLAEDNYKRTMELEPNNPEFTLAIGKIRLNQAAVSKGEDEKKNLIGEAKDLFNKSIEQKNNFAAGYYHLAIAQGVSEELDQAIESMTKAVSLNRNSVDYYFNLARLYQQRGQGDDYKMAESLFQEILKVNDKEINTHFSLAGLYERMKENDKAIKEYERVVELLPADNEEIKNKVKEMIENVKNGTGNLQDNEASQEIKQEIDQDIQQGVVQEESVVPTEQPAQQTLQPEEQSVE